MIARPEEEERLQQRSEATDKAKVSLIRPNPSFVPCFNSFSEFVLDLFAKRFSGTENICYELLLVKL